MRIDTLRKELHFAIDAIKNTDVLEAIKVLIDRNHEEYALTGEQEKELDKRLASHFKGDNTYTPWKKSLKASRDKLKK
jgi:hypothetical protein